MSSVCMQLVMLRHKATCNLNCTQGTTWPIRTSVFILDFVLVSLSSCARSRPLEPSQRWRPTSHMRELRHRHKGYQSGHQPVTALSYTSYGTSQSHTKATHPTPTPSWPQPMIDANHALRAPP